MKINMFQKIKPIYILKNENIFSKKKQYTLKKTLYIFKNSNYIFLKRTSIFQKMKLNI